MISWFESTNHNLFFLINNGLHSSINDVWIGNATYLGIGWITYVIALLSLYLIDRKNFKWSFIVLLVAALSEGVLLQVAKYLVDAPRPLSEFAGLIKSGSVVVNVMFDPLYGRSFPSGHTQTAFCAATVISLVAISAPIERLPKRIIFAVSFGLAVLVGISRIYVGAHFPTDVVGGAVLGILPAWYIMKLFAKRKREAVPDTAHLGRGDERMNIDRK